MCEECGCGEIYLDLDNNQNHDQHHLHDSVDNHHHDHTRTVPIDLPALQIK